MINIKQFKKEDIDKVIDFEKELRRQELNTYFWNIDEDYKIKVLNTFADKNFDNAFSFLAVDNDDVIGRIDVSLIVSRCNGIIETAFLDWICVLKSRRHEGIGQAMINHVKRYLKEKGITSFIVLTSENEEAKRYYDAMEKEASIMRALWFNL